MGSKIEVIQGDLLTSDRDYIVHQCNCVTTSGAGLAAQIIRRFPYANPYGRRRSGRYRSIAQTCDFDVPGTISVLSSPGHPHVVNLFAQWERSKPLRYDTPCPYGKDSEVQRKKWFSDCLNQFAMYLMEGDLSKKVTIAFPYGIGCGMAGGKWDDYRFILNAFANKVHKIATVYLYER